MLQNKNYFVLSINSKLCATIKQNENLQYKYIKKRVILVKQNTKEQHIRRQLQHFMCEKHKCKYTDGNSQKENEFLYSNI